MGRASRDGIGIPSQYVYFLERLYWSNFHHRKFKQKILKLSGMGIYRVSDDFLYVFSFVATNVIVATREVLIC